MPLIGLLFAIACVALVGCGGASSSDGAPGGAERAAAVVFDGDLPPLPTAVTAALDADQPVIAWVSHGEGRLEPCGCVAGMHGGLVRRASLLHRVGSGPVLTLENGGWTGGDADYQRLRTRTYLQGLQLVGVAAVGLGGVDVGRGAAALDEMTADLDLPLVSANVQRADGSPYTAAYRRQAVGDQPFILTSVSPPATGEGLQVLDPAEALLNLVGEVGATAPIIVLADLPPAGLEALANAVPGLALIVGGQVEDPSPTPIAVGATRIIHVANHGKTLGWWPWRDPACHFELIEDHVPDHPGIRDLVRDYQSRLAGMDLAIDDRIEGLTTLDGGQADGRHFVGSLACLGCHAEAHQVHVASRHHHGLESLIEKGYQHDPDCLRCHVTGLGRPDGFRRMDEATAHLGEVSCESCHGRGSQHVAERAAGKASSGSLAIVTPASCVRCHDAENSPHFEYHGYWERIKHE